MTLMRTTLLILILKTKVQKCSARLQLHACNLQFSNLRCECVETCDSTFKLTFTLLPPATRM